MLHVSPDRVFEKGEEYYRARNLIACDLLLAKLYQNHPDHAITALKGIEPIVVELEPPPPPKEIEIVEHNAGPVKVPVHEIIRKSGEPLVSFIISEAAAFFKISELELLAARRNKQLVYKRHVAIYVAKTLTVRSLPEIGKAFGGMDHTTILHAVRKVERNLESEPDMKLDIDALRGRVMRAVVACRAA